MSRALFVLFSYVLKVLVKAMVTLDGASESEAGDRLHLSPCCRLWRRHSFMFVFG